MIEEDDQKKMIKEEMNRRKRFGRKSCFRSKRTVKVSVEPGYSNDDSNERPNPSARRASQVLKEEGEGEEEEEDTRTRWRRYVLFVHVPHIPDVITCVLSRVKCATLEGGRSLANCSSIDLVTRERERERDEEEVEEVEECENERIALEGK
jgi:hypothetical protein